MINVLQGHHPIFNLQKANIYIPVICEKLSSLITSIWSIANYLGWQPFGFSAHGRTFIPPRYVLTRNYPACDWFRTSDTKTQPWPMNPLGYL